MPELPEVRVASRAISQKVENKKIVNVEVALGKLIKEISEEDFRKQLLGKRISKVTNKGKFILFIFHENLVMLCHLRMTGQYFFYEEAPQVIRRNIHLIFTFEDNSELHYSDYRQFSTFQLRTKDEYLTTFPLKKLALEPAETNVNELFKETQKTKKAIKTFLLDQTKLVGLGNIYVNETLWVTRVNPSLPANEVSKYKLHQILEQATLIMDHSTRLGGSTIDSYASLNKRQGEFQKLLKVHGKDGKHCPRCQSILLKNRVNGRGTYFCPNCQKLK